MSTLDAVMAYEAGQMDEDQIVEFFQELVDTGLAWQLQGSYGRTARALIEAGWVVPPDVQRPVGLIDVPHDLAVANDWHNAPRAD